MMDDLISRQATIRWVKTECNPYGKPTLEYESGKKVIEYLETMPSAQPEIDSQKEVARYVAAFSDGYDRGKADAQPERKKGQWILDPKSGRYRCSGCLAFAARDDFGNEYLSDYCSVCGTEMRGEDNG